SKQGRILCRRAPNHVAVSQQDLQSKHVLPKCARQMMILAVHIASDGAPHGDIFGSGRNWGKPAPWHEQLEKLRKGNPSSARQAPRGSVEVLKKIQATGPDDMRR